MHRKSSKRLIRIIAINLLVLVVAADLVGLFLNYVANGDLYYLHHTAPALIEETTEHTLTGEGLHPYFGQTHRPGVRFDVPASLQNPATPAELKNNNFGFVSPHDYPFRS